MKPMIAGLVLLAAAAPWGGLARAQPATTPEDGTRDRPAAAPRPQDASRPTPPAAALEGRSGGDARPTPAVGPTGFSEDQARSRLRDAGYVGISGLRQDDLGVWRGRANRNGSAVDVSIDREGKVVEGTGAEH
jgi:hypothetical protein